MTVTLTECTGMWRRTLLVAADGTRDTGGDVRWLQGTRGYVDSRGFAGTLAQRDDVFTWHRDLDAAAPEEHPDEGRVHWDGATLVEHGVHADYAEHWDRAPGPATPCWALRLSRPGAAAILMRVGEWFGFADGATAHVDLVDGPVWRALDIDIGDGRCTAGGRSWTTKPLR